MKWKRKKGCRFVMKICQIENVKESSYLLVTCDKQKINEKLFETSFQGKKNFFLLK